MLMRVVQTPQLHSSAQKPLSIVVYYWGAPLTFLLVVTVGCRFVFPADVLRRISSRITNEVAGINRVTYDISSKPPAVSELIYWVCLM